MKRTNSQSGFSLLELMLYISITSLLLFSVSISSQAFLEARIKNQVIADVNGQGSSAMNLILQTIRQADAITSVTVGNTVLTLDMPGTASSTIFKLESDKLSISEDGGTTWIDLTDSGKVIVSAISGDTGIFKNLSRALTPGIIRVRFNVAHTDPADTNPYFQNFAADFQGAASLR